MKSGRTFLKECCIAQIQKACNCKNTDDVTGYTLFACSVRMDEILFIRELLKCEFFSIAKNFFSEREEFGNYKRENVQPDCHMVKANP